jgi:hypothetical protein
MDKGSYCSENKTIRSFIHVNHTSYMDLSIQAKTRQYDPLSMWITLHTWTSKYKRKQDNTLVFACIEKSMYEVWFTWIKDRVVLFSLVLRSPCMKCDSQHDPLSMWITLHTCTSQYKWKQDNTILYPCESHFIRGLLNTSENKTTWSFIRVRLYWEVHVWSVIHMDKGSCCLVFACI